jgi:EAL domain-containing protein (putative c-di-GMP-specific phosphodiesterase class I)
MTDDATPALDLVRNADLAMYTAKRDGGACHRLYVDTMHDAAIARLDLTADLDRTLDEGALDVVYQPVVLLGTGAITGFEALARWQHPLLGPISPTEFIPLAEETGLIDRLGHFVLSRVCADLAAWRLELGPDAVPVVSVNLSPQQLADVHLPGLVGAALTSSGVPADRLCLEVTESGLGGSDVEVTRALRQIRDLGVQLSLDDFGTGHSSLSRLGGYPFDVVKIDRSFVSRLADGVQDRAVVEAVVRLAAAFTLDVVAEGVETSEQADILAGLGCERVQGFLFSRPVPAAAALDLLRSATVLPR